MLDIILCGCNGRMGKAVAEAFTANGDRIVAGIDINPGAAAPFPVFSDPALCRIQADVIVDFSHHAALPGLLAFAKAQRTPLVIATTGHTEEELAEMREAAAETPVFFSRNMSLGINLLLSLCREAAKTLWPDFDTEIIEMHHGEKLDAPSGTALMLADTIRETDSQPHPYVFDRHNERRKRRKGEIGISSLRGGTVVGEHEVIFAGKDEVIKISHSATSREVFSTGALRAAHFMAGKPAGLYSMEDVIRAL